MILSLLKTNQLGFKTKQCTTINEIHISISYIEENSLGKQPKTSFKPKISFKFRTSSANVFQN